MPNWNVSTWAHWPISVQAGNCRLLGGDSSAGSSVNRPETRSASSLPSAVDCDARRKPNPYLRRSRGWISPFESIRFPDCGRIRDVLKRDGWSHELEAIADHHFAVRRKNGFLSGTAFYPAEFQWNSGTGTLERMYSDTGGSLSPCAFAGIEFIIAVSLPLLIDGYDQVLQDPA